MFQTENKPPHIPISDIFVSQDASLTVPESSKKPNRLKTRYFTFYNVNCQWQCTSCSCFYSYTEQNSIFERE